MHIAAFLILLLEVFRSVRHGARASKCISSSLISRSKVNGWEPIRDEQIQKHLYCKILCCQRQKFFPWSAQTINFEIIKGRRRLTEPVWNLISKVVSVVSLMQPAHNIICHLSFWDHKNIFILRMEAASSNLKETKELTKIYFKRSWFCSECKVISLAVTLRVALKQEYWDCCEVWRWARSWEERNTICSGKKIHLPSVSVFI